MIREGICSICGKPGVLHTCNLCGALVCSNCYDAERGLCKNCASKFLVK